MSANVGLLLRNHLSEGTWVTLAKASGALRGPILYMWNGPASLPYSLRLEWRFVAIRWIGIVFVAAGLLRMDLPANRAAGAYEVLAIAAVYSLAIQLTIRKYAKLFASGYLTTVCDALLNIGMMLVVGGFDTPFYYILYTVAISAAMRYGYGPAVLMVLVFISFDALENRPGKLTVDGPYFFRSGFLLMTAVLAGYLQEQALRAEAALAVRLQQANALNRELEAFSYSVSHDLRAPLRSIDGFSQALLEDYADKLDAEGKDLLSRVRTNSQRMARLIDDLLQLSRVTRSEMRRERVDLGALARTVAEEVRGSDPQREVEFVIAEGGVVRGDARLLRVVIENLLGNAWKFTSKHPRAKIEFGITQQDNRPVYFVRDDGAGFDPHFSDKLFGAFQRLHGSMEFEGTGIGLATVQRIIQRHGGRVWAHGAVEGGATFYFTL